ncbi:tRNA-specific 2-thiouridylase [Desulfovibrio sp. OttesenSCG-928-G15]|nr:tRNA-specific 2-thiouridylase [Desulfovibrio sp. OttesenSCG-928-G15]
MAPSATHRTPGKTAPVAVAVSGGADSLYALLRLKEQGHTVIALHGIFLAPENAESARRAEAMRKSLEAACTRLAVPLHAIDCVQAFAEKVIAPFVAAYAEGLTPNPCALCNASIKFGLLLDEALRLGANTLATGHYAGIAFENARACLYQGGDHNKDQSYFLALVPPAALARARFPLESITKPEVLAVLERHGFTAPQPGESQEVCFVPQDDYRAILPELARRYGKTLPGPGPMLLTDGTQLGRHQGLWRYTEGQRRGLGVGWKEPLHVLGKEMQGNILRLGPRQAMRGFGCLCTDLNILLPPEEWPASVLVKTRYREKPKQAVVDFVPPVQSQNLTQAQATDAPSRQDKGESQGKVNVQAGDSPPNAMRIRFVEEESLVACGQIAAVYAQGTDGRLRLAAGGVIRAAL